jgi:hypothetical protein
MRAKVTITLADQTSEEKLLTHGFNSEMLLELYYKAFENILEEFKVEGMTTDLHIIVDDNTKESKQ